MAVTVTAATLQGALQLEGDAAGLAKATALLELATALVLRRCPTAPDSIHNEAVTRTAGYILVSTPDAGVVKSVEAGDVKIMPRTPGDPVRLSGAGALLSLWRIRRAAKVTP